MLFTIRRATSTAVIALILVFGWRTLDSRKQRHIVLGTDEIDITADEGNSKSTPKARQPFYPGAPKSNYSRILVLPKLKSENVNWISQELPDIPAAIYEVDNPSTEYHVPKHKGHEAMVYLTYIMDHYGSLPDTITFIHSHKS